MDYRGDYRRDYGMDYRMDSRRDYGDYRGDYRDYATESDYGSEEEEYKKHLHEWTEKLKKKDRIKVFKEQVLRQAKNMKVEFKDFDEEGNAKDAAQRTDGWCESDAVERRL